MSAGPSGHAPQGLPGEPTYMGEGWEEFCKLADVDLVVQGVRLPAHTLILAQHSAVLLGMAAALRQSGWVGDA